MLFTERDAQMVAWIGRMGAASIGHVAGWFGISDAAAYQRLRVLGHEGLLDHRLVLHARPALYWATRKGLRWQGIGRFRAFRVDAMGLSTRIEPPTPRSSCTVCCRNGGLWVSGRYG